MKLFTTHNLAAGAIALSLALPVAAQETSIETGECINTGDPHVYRLCVRNERRQQAAISTLTTGARIKTNSLADKTQERFNTYTTQQSQTIGRCNQLFNQLTVTNNLVAYNAVEAVVRCYQNADKSMMPTMVQPTNTRANVRMSTQSSLRTSTSTANKSKRVVITNNYSAGTGVPSNSTTTKEADSQVIIEDSSDAGTGVPMNN